MFINEIKSVLKETLVMAMIIIIIFGSATITKVVQDYTTQEVVEIVEK